MSLQLSARFLAGLVVATALAACVTQPLNPEVAVPHYLAPASGPTARLMLRVSQPGGRYVVSTYEQPVSCSQRREMISGTVHEPERQTFTIAANKLQTLTFMYARPDRQVCQIIFSFEPKAGSTYLMRNTANAEGCQVEMINATNVDAPLVERTRVARDRLGWGLNDNACKPLLSAAPRSAPAGAATAPANSLEPFKDLLPRR